MDALTQLELPASNAGVLAMAINPALECLPPMLRSDPARCMLLAIGRHESNFATRQQHHGPAHGLWQFELNGVRTVLYSSKAGNYLYRLGQDLGVRYGSITIYDALLTDDVLAAGLARLMLWADPHALPAIGDAEGAWACYLRCWNPGRRDVYARFQRAHADAVDTIRG